MADIKINILYSTMMANMYSTRRMCTTIKHVPLATYAVDAYSLLQLQLQQLQL